MSNASQRIRESFGPPATWTRVTLDLVAGAGFAAGVGVLLARLLDWAWWTALLFAASHLFWTAIVTGRRFLRGGRS
jgi:hypothetical protein